MLLPEPRKVISHFIHAMCFYISKGTGRNFPLQNPTQDWPLPSIELNIHPQDVLSCSGLLCSSGLNEMQRGSENSPFIFAINKESVLWEFGDLRLLGIERFQGTALKLHTAPLDYFCWNSVLRFLKVCLHTKYTIRYFPEKYLCSWPDLEKSPSKVGFQWGSAWLILVSMKHKELQTSQGDSDPHLVPDASNALALCPPTQPHILLRIKISKYHILFRIQNLEFFWFVQFSAWAGHGCYFLHVTLW